MKLDKESDRLEAALSAKEDELLAQAALVVELRQRAERAEGELARLQPLVEAAVCVVRFKGDCQMLEESRHRRLARYVKKAGLETWHGAEEGGEDE